MPDDLLPMLLDLMRLPAIPGRETAVADRLQAAWAPLADEIRRTPAGSVCATRQGSGKKPRPCVMLTGHMDAIGLVVADFEGGFLRLASAGTMMTEHLAGQRVLVHGKRLVPGLLVRPPEHCLPPDKDGDSIPLGAFLVDTGLGARQLQALVRIGDAITFDRMGILLGDGVVAGPALDNRAGLAALTLGLHSLSRAGHAWDVVLAGLVQEETGGLGARTITHAAPPTIALVIDTTYGRGHGEAEHLTFPLGGGPSNGWGPAAHPAVHERLRLAAERAEVPLTLEPMPRYSESDAGLLQVAGTGVATGCLFVPVRNMHSPVEVVDLEDIRRTAAVLTEFVRGLDDAAARSLDRG
jgi:putative aminopeptidase FrvX